MNIVLHSLPKRPAVLLCSILALTGICATAQSATNAESGIDALYYVLGGGILVVFIATIFVIQKMAKISGEYGLALFDFEFPIFRRMAKSGRMVGIIMVLLVLWGIYLVVTYQAI